MAEMLGFCPVISRSSPEKPLYGNPRGIDPLGLGRSTIPLRRTASGVGLYLLTAVRGLVAGRALLPEGTCRVMDAPPPYFAGRRSPVAEPSSVSRLFAQPSGRSSRLRQAQ